MNTRITTLLLALAASSSIAACNGGNDHPDTGTDVSPNDATQSDGDDTSTGDDSSTSAARDFTLRGRELTSSMGHPMGVFVVETTGGREMGFAWTASIAGPEVELRLPSLVPEGDYRADVFVDLNGNGTFETGDTSWSIPIPSQGSATASFAASEANVDLSTLTRLPRTDFSANLSGFASDEAGHHFELRVIDPGSGATVGGYSTDALPSGSLSFTLPGILDEGTAYQIDFWVDMDGNGTYSGPQSDHTWRETLNGTALTWSHSDTYTELDWR